MFWLFEVKSEIIAELQPPSIYASCYIVTRYYLQSRLQRGASNLLEGLKTVFRGVCFTPKFASESNFDLESHLVLFLQQQALLASLTGARTIYSSLIISNVLYFP